MNRAKEYGLFSTFNLFDYYYKRIKSLVLNLIEWKNLPDNLTSNLIEEYLFQDGKCVFFKDDILGYIVLPFYELTKDLIIKQPKQIIAMCENGYNKTLENNKDCKVIYNSFSKISMGDLTYRYAVEFENLKNSMAVNINSQKTPIIGILQDKKTKLTVENLLNQHATNVPYILFSGEINLNEVLKVLDLKSPYLADKFQILIQNLWNEMLTYFGVQNSHESKKERLTSGEVEENNAQVQVYRDVFLQPRKEAANKINKLFNLNIEVEYRHPIITNSKFNIMELEERLLNE